MKSIICIALIVFMLVGCAGERADLPDAVTVEPEWSQEENEKDTGPPMEPEILVHLDNTQSTHGFAGKCGAMLDTVSSITDRACFDDKVSTWILEPKAGSKILEWQERNPRFLQSALVKEDWDLYTINDENFAKGTGGPLRTVFGGEADPANVRVLITDLLEQESCLESLSQYVEALFRDDGHQQLRIYIANAPFKGKVSFPVIVGEKFGIRNSEFTGQRPFVVIAVGPAAGVEKFHEIISASGVDFTEFMVENHRQEPKVSMEITAGDVMQNEIFVNDPAAAKCSVDVEAMEMEDCFAFRYHKYSAQKARASRVSILVTVDAGTVLTKDDVRWWEWTEPEEEGADALWVPCGAPEDAVLEVKKLSAGAAISDRTAEESGISDITIPRGKTVYEISLRMGEASKAYAVELGLNTPLPGNALAELDSFQIFDTSFAHYGMVSDADKILAAEESTPAERKAAETLKIETLSRIPDLQLLLSALAEMDDSSTGTRVGSVKIILQNYETHN